MSRARTGSLIWRKSGWSARYWATRDGKPVRVCECLGSHNREAAERELQRRIENPKPLSAQPKPMVVHRIDLACSVCGETISFIGPAAATVLGGLRRGRKYHCGKRCLRKDKHRYEHARALALVSPEALLAAADRLSTACKERMVRE